jgi:uncharacterized sodium:solute symporter family permease YidK
MKEETQKAYTYLKQEAPEVGREYVQWKMAESWLAAAACIVCACALAYAANRLWKLKDGLEAFAVFPFIAVIVFTLIAFMRAADFAKCLVAPRIVIIEGIKEIVK